MALKFTLCGFKTCPWVQRTAIVLQAKQVPYDITYIDRDHRPDWFASMSPHGKVPLLVIDGRQALFESNAIVEYLDDTLPPRLHPEDAVMRARNRAWTDFLPAFARDANRAGYAATEEEFAAALKKLPGVFGKLEEALAARAGPYFNGEKFSLVDAGYAPMLQRHGFIERLHPIGEMAKFPRLAAWRDALLAAPQVKSSTVPDIENLWRQNVVRRNGWLARFVPQAEEAGVK